MTVDPAALARVCEQNDIVRLRIFGSFARGEATPESDVDLLADFGGPKGLFDLVQAEDELAEVFGRRVDLLTEGGLSPYIKPHILSEARVLYERAA
jgi:predicted nucleotidyltransferase